MQAADDIECNWKFADIMRKVKENEDSKSNVKVFVPTNIDQMLKYLCEQARKNQIRDAILTSYKRAEQPNQLVESTWKAGEAFVKLFEFTAQDFKKKSANGVYFKLK